MAKTKTAKKKQPAGEHTDEQPASSLMDLVKTDPLEALTLGGAALQTLDERYERRRSKLLGVAYAVACRLYREWPEWKKFVRAELWKRRTKKPRLHKDRNRVLLLAFRYMLGALDQEADKKAWLYATALEAYFNKGVKPEDISQKICMNGGIRALYDKALVERRKARQHARIFADDYFEVGAKRPNGSGLNSAPEASDDVGADENTSESAPGLSGKSKRIRVQFPAQIKRRLQRVSVRAQVSVRLERREDRDGRMRFKAVGVIADEASAPPKDPSSKARRGSSKAGRGLRLSGAVPSRDLTKATRRGGTATRAGRRGS